MKQQFAAKHPWTILAAGAAIQVGCVSCVSLVPTSVHAVEHTLPTQARSVRLRSLLSKTSTKESV